MFRSPRAWILGLLLLSPHAIAEAGDWLFRFGGHYVDPKSDNHSVVEVEAATMVTFNGTYFITDRWALELLAALPYTHDIDLVGGGNVGETKHLPPTFSVQYHFMPTRNVRPYFGVGVNYTIFFEEDTTGALAGSRLSLEDSVGPSAQLGLDIDLNERWFLNAEIRWMDIDTKAKLNGTSLGTVSIDPWAYGLNLGFRL